jgi:hypothetical protein
MDYLLEEKESSKYDSGYEKPEIQKIEIMNFPMESIKKLSLEKVVACRQCSSCHGCR